MQQCTPHGKHASWQRLMQLATQVSKKGVVATKTPPKTLQKNPFLYQKKPILTKPPCFYHTKKPPDNKVYQKYPQIWPNEPPTLPTPPPPPRPKTFPENPPIATNAPPPPTYQNSSNSY